jgi:hypothetical protein
MVVIATKRRNAMTDTTDAQQELRVTLTVRDWKVEQMQVEGRSEQGEWGPLKRQLDKGDVASFRECAKALDRKDDITQTRVLRRST